MPYGEESEGSNGWLDDGAGQRGAPPEGAAREAAAGTGPGSAGPPLLAAEGSPDPAGELEPSVLEDMAGRVRGVYACRVSVGEREQAPRRVRVMVAEDRRAAVARDIQSAWYAAFGVYVPLGHFTVTAVRSPAEAHGEPKRFQLSRIGYGQEDGQTQAHVALVLGDDSFSGTAGYEGRRVDWLRLVAEATLAAVAGAMVGGPRLALTEVLTTTAAGREVVMAAVQLPGSGAGRNLLGACFVGRDPRESAARAVLDAVNRQVDRYL